MPRVPLIMSLFSPAVGILLIFQLWNFQCLLSGGFLYVFSSMINKGYIFICLFHCIYQLKLIEIKKIGNYQLAFKLKWEQFDCDAVVSNK